MDEKPIATNQNPSDINTLPANTNTEPVKTTTAVVKSPDKDVKVTEPVKTTTAGVKSPDKDVKVTQPIKKKKNSFKSLANFIYDPRKKTVLGRSALNWAKLAAFYTIFYFCLGCFFIFLLYVFALILSRTEPTYYNTESTMAVRTTATVVGMGFRPQPVVDDNLIKVTDNEAQQIKIASSLRLFRDVYLIQKPDAKVADCSDDTTAASLPPDTACEFSWTDIVHSQEHPCSDNNYYGFKNEAPCVLVKLNKVYGWTPNLGALHEHIQKLRDIPTNKTVADSDVYITCAGTHYSDIDALTTASLTYFSLETPQGSSKFGIIPHYFFPYRNAPGHVQPFVLVQFKNLPLNRLISVTCKAYAPGIEHDTRAMRGMVSFQLYRTHEKQKSEN